MNAVRQALVLVRWDLVREIRRKETVLNMTLFAVLILFAGRVGVETFAPRVAGEPSSVVRDQEGGRPRQASESMGPIFFWISALFAGTVGLHHSFAAEREGSSLGAITTAPVDPGVFYLAKVAATWLYVMVMQLALSVAYVVLFDYPPGDTWPMILAALASFTLAYVAPGVVLAAMTTSLGGASEVILRILLFALMIPLVLLTFEVSAELFGFLSIGGTGPALALADFGPTDYIAIALAFAAIYLAAGFLLFPKVLEE